MRRPLCVIDHVGNSGGGVKYVLHLLDGLREDWDITINAQPVAIERYQRAAAGQPLPFRQTWPLNLLPVLADRSPIFAWWTSRLYCGHRGWTFRIRPEAHHDSSICFFPWLHRHDLGQFRGHGLGVFHDAIFFQRPEMIGSKSLARETANLHTWFDKLDKIVVTSQHTKRRLLHIAGEQRANQVSVIPVADFDRPTGLTDPGPQATRRFGRYLVMPANTSIHKNHRLLLQAMRRSVGPWKLVLTGDGTADGPKSAIGRVIAEAGLADRVFGLGYVGQELVARLIADAEALVMPTLGEGGGSFPVCEAIAAGTPVIASNLDVIEEQVERMGAQVTLFDPTSVDALVRALDRLAGDPTGFRRAAAEQVPRLRLRTWEDVARDFARLLRELYPERQNGNPERVPMPSGDGPPRAALAKPAGSSRD
jgi:glycosyltransferase involved in cell wall biosynthesis